MEQSIPKTFLEEGGTYIKMRKICRNTQYRPVSIAYTICMLMFNVCYRKAIYFQLEEDNKGTTENEPLQKALN
jgi:hypothetical protein